MSRTWNILMVDDEPDIHEVSRLALKRKKWRKRSINVVSAYSRKEAEEVIRKHEGDFHVGLIDVVMESDEAGLELCRFIRNNCPRTFRIVLRTGQPGVAPEEFVLNEYDIDYYLAKGDATPERIYNVLRACLRSSEDIATLMAYSGQLRDFTEVLSAKSPMDQILGVMGDSLGFLERKHRVRCTFVPDVSQLDSTAIIDADSEIVAPARISEIVSKLAPAANYQAHRGSDHGLPDHGVVIRFDIAEEQKAEAEQTDTEAAEAPEATFAGTLGGLGAEFHRKDPTDKEVTDFAVDARLFIDNWRVAFSTLKLQAKLAQETMLRMEEAMSKAVMAKELEVASAVQSTMVPDDALVELDSIKLAGYFQPATQCGGDWWNYYHLADDKVLVVIGDVTGHGAGSAMITATAKGAATTIITATEGKIDVGELLRTINLAIYDAAKGSYLMTCFASIYDHHTNTLTYANAGHNFPYLFEDGKIKVLVSRGVRLGDLPENEFPVHETQIQPGSTLLWFTDGIVEMQNPKGDELGEKWLYKRFRKRAQLEPDEIRDDLVTASQKWADGTPLDDDVTLVVGRFTK